MFIFQAKYLAVLELFAGKDDIRYYLNGYSVRPHPAGGVLLRATNGHICCFIHDKEGQCKGDHLLARNPELLRHLKPPRGKHGKLGKDAQHWVCWSGAKSARVTVRGLALGSKPKKLSDGLEVYAAPLNTGFDGTFIDGKFPDTDAVLPRQGELVPGLHGYINADYVGLLGKASKLLGKYRGGSYPSTVFASAGTEGRGIITARFDMPAEDSGNFLALLMPMVGDDYTALPALDQYRLVKPAPTKKKARKKPAKTKEAEPA